MVFIDIFIITYIQLVQPVFACILVQALEHRKSTSGHIPEERSFLLSQASLQGEHRAFFQEWTHREACQAVPIFSAWRLFSSLRFGEEVGDAE